MSSDKKLDDLLDAVTFDITTGVARIQVLRESVDEHTEKYESLILELSVPEREISNEQAEKLVGAYSELLGLIGTALEISVATCDSFADSVSNALRGAGSQVEIPGLPRAFLSEHSKNGDKP